MDTTMLKTSSISPNNMTQQLIQNRHYIIPPAVQFIPHLQLGQDIPFSLRTYPSLDVLRALWMLAMTCLP
jgi:hypothetical protein